MNAMLDKPIPTANTIKEPLKFFKVSEFVMCFSVLGLL